MAATFSIENQIKRRLDSLGVTSDFLSALAGIPPSRLSLAFREIRALDTQQGLALLKILDRLDALVAQASPVPVSFRSPGAIRDLLADLEDGRVRIAVETVNQ